MSCEPRASSKLDRLPLIARSSLLSLFFFCQRRIHFQQALGPIHLDELDLKIDPL
jgi:hypothetical protein